MLAAPINIHPVNIKASKIIVLEEQLFNWLSIRLVIEYISIEKDLHLIIVFLVGVVYVGDKGWDIRFKRAFLVNRKGFCLIINNPLK